VEGSLWLCGALQARIKDKVKRTKEKVKSYTELSSE